MSTAQPAPKVDLILQVKVFFDPKDRETFLAAFKPVYDLVVAEPECAYFFFGEDVQEPGAFRWTEGWTKDVTWFMTVGLSYILYREECIHKIRDSDA